MSDAATSVSDDLEIDGDVMAAEIAAHSASTPATAAQPAPQAQIIPPVEIEAELVPEVPVAVAPAAEAFIRAYLERSALNELL